MCKNIHRKQLPKTRLCISKNAKRLLLRAASNETYLRYLIRGIQTEFCSHRRFIQAAMISTNSHTSQRITSDTHSHQRVQAAPMERAHCSPQKITLPRQLELFSKLWLTMQQDSALRKTNGRKPTQCGHDSSQTNTTNPTSNSKRTL